MTTLLYYEDTDLLEFDARILDCTTNDGKTEVVLDRTAFYPEGGGQPADRGTIGESRILHVRKEDGVVFHLVDQEVTDEVVHCTVDGDRRRDYAQQHTGQHILSAALLRVGDFNTVSVHQGEEYTTIEVDKPSITTEEVVAVERIANQTIEQDVPVSTVWVDESTIQEYPLRRPPKVSGSIRLVLVGDGQSTATSEVNQAPGDVLYPADTAGPLTDCAACGGVHTTRTGQVRLVRAVGVESIRGNTRIAFMIGDRAIADYAMKDEIVRRLGSHLSAKPDEILDRVAAQEDRVKRLESEAKQLHDRLYTMIAERLVRESPGASGSEVRVVVHGFQGEPKDFLRGVMDALIQTRGLIACLTNIGEENLQWSIGAGEDVDVDFNRIRSDLLPLIDGKGGGRPPIWQGVGASASDLHAFHEGCRGIADWK